MWLYTLAVLGRHSETYRQKGVDLVRQIHAPFLVPGRSIIWKMQEDLSGSYDGTDFGVQFTFSGTVVYSESLIAAGM